MPKFRVYTEPGGNVRVLHPNEKMRNPGESDDDFIARMGAHAEGADSSLTGLPSIDVVDATIIALDRSKRHKWRVQGPICRVDNTVPDKPHPRQAALDQINAATDVTTLKQALIDFVRG